MATFSLLCCQIRAQGGANFQNYSYLDTTPVCSEILKSVEGVAKFNWASMIVIASLAEHHATVRS